MEMSPSTMERGMETSVAFLEIMSKVILREEEENRAGQSEPIEHLDTLKKQVEEQQLASIALKELLLRQLPRLKEEAAAKAPPKIQKGTASKNNKKTEITADEVKILQQAISLF